MEEAYLEIRAGRRLVSHYIRGAVNTIPTTAKHKCNDFFILLLLPFKHFILYSRISGISSNS